MKSETGAGAIRLLILIATPRLAEKAVALFDEARAPLQYRLDGHGTATREVMDMLGLDSGDKNILMSMLPKPLAMDMLARLRRGLRLGAMGSGIAFTVPLSAGSHGMIQILEAAGRERRGVQRRMPVMEENAYQMVIAVVNQGYSEDVMAAARPAGATGGTVLHSRRVGNEETMAFYGISVQPEKEIVAILCRQEEKLAIMQAVAQACGMRSEAQGLILALPVESVAGLD